MRHQIIVSLASLLVLAPLPATAEVTASSEHGFVSHHAVEVGASPEDVWALLLDPSEWWNGDHTYSGSASNMTIAPEAGGCFCERVPASEDARDGQIEHMRVIYLSPRSTLRMTGALGPLQSEAVTAVLTVTIEPTASGSRIVWDYVVGGYMRMPIEQIAPLVDQVIGEQLARLAGRADP